MGSNLMNQRADIGKIPKDFNPPKILNNSFESKEPYIDNHARSHACTGRMQPHMYTHQRTNSCRSNSCTHAHSMEHTTHVHNTCMHTHSVVECTWHKHAHTLGRRMHVNNTCMRTHSVAWRRAPSAVMSGSSCYGEARTQWRLRISCSTSLPLLLND